MLIKKTKEPGQAIYTSLLPKIIYNINSSDSIIRYFGIYTGVILLKDIIKLAVKFENRLDSDPKSLETPPVSLAPVSIQRHKDLTGSIRHDLAKSNKYIASILLEDAQRHLAHGIARSLEGHGYRKDARDIHKQLLEFGEYNGAENEFIESFSSALNQYGDKAVHYIINNLSW
jgi:hypothetical protein